jgi:hypothetical protein
MWYRWNYETLMPVSATMGHVSHNLIIMLHGAYDPRIYQTTLEGLFNFDQGVGMKYLHSF